MKEDKDFIAFLETYKMLLIKIAGVYCRDEEERKDLIQEMIIQLWRSFSKYDSAISTSTWVYRIAMNVSISYVRKTSTRIKAMQHYREEQDFIHLEDEVLQQRLNLMYDSIKYLSDFDKAIITLHLDECKNKDIADILGISPSNVSTRLLRIKEQLKTYVKPTN